MDNNTNAATLANVATALTSHRYAPSADSAPALFSGPGAFGADASATGQFSAQGGRTGLTIDATAFMKAWAPPPRRDPL